MDIARIKTEIDQEFIRLPTITDPHIQSYTKKIGYGPPDIKKQVNTDYEVDLAGVVKAISNEEDDQGVKTIKFYASMV